jgi:hypothetical protein
MAGSKRKEELEQRLRQSRQLKAGARDATTYDRLVQLIDELEAEQKPDAPEKK